MAEKSEREKLKERAYDLARATYTDTARSFWGQADAAAMSEMFALAIALGDAEVHGAVTRTVVDQEPAEAAEFILFTSTGVWSITLANTDGMFRGGRELERLTELQLTPSSMIRSLTVGRLPTDEWMAQTMEPGFTIHLDDLGPVKVDRTTSNSDSIRGPLFAHVRDLIAARN